MWSTIEPTGLVRVVSSDEAIARLTEECREFEDRFGEPTASLERAFRGADPDDLETGAARRAWRNARSQLARLTAHASAPAVTVERAPGDPELVAVPRSAAG